MTNGSPNSGGSSKLKGYGAAAGIVVGLLTALLTFGEALLDRLDPADYQQPPAYSDYDTVVSDDKSLSVEIPSKWRDVAANEDWYFPTAPSGAKVGPAIHASTSLTLWYGGRFEVPGLTFVASDAVEVVHKDDRSLLEIDDGYYSDLCSFRDKREVLKNDNYKITRDVWKECGPKEAEVWNVAARPQDGDYVTMLEIDIFSEADREAADRILNTIQVDEDELSELQLPEESQAQPTPDPETMSDEKPLDDLVQQQVGDFTLQGSAEKWSEAAETGATQALQMDYETPEDGSLRHLVATYESPDEAKRTLQASVDELISEDWVQAIEETPLEDELGNQFGTATWLESKVEGDTYRLVLWTNGNLHARALGKEVTAVVFLETSRYGGCMEQCLTVRR